MTDVVISMKLTQKQAGALYLKSVKLERQLTQVTADYAEIQADRGKLQTELFNTREGRDQMASKAAALDALIVEMQERAALYLQPDGEPNANFISYILTMLDGPEQRAAQAAPVQCLANVRADAIENASNALYNAGVADASASDWLILHAAKVRGGAV